jgi:hypothetical protein
VGACAVLARHITGLDSVVLIRQQRIAFARDILYMSFFQSFLSTACILHINTSQNFQRRTYHVESEDLIFTGLNSEYDLSLRVSSSMVHRMCKVHRCIVHMNIQHGQDKLSTHILQASTDEIEKHGLYKQTILNTISHINLS